MSGPVTEQDVEPTRGGAAQAAAAAGGVEIIESRVAQVGGLPVARALPRRARRTVGAWCFLDHAGPVDAAMHVGPHPHMGLHTVTWLLDGEVLHRDSLGNEQNIVPGQLNLMTAGHGIAHAEESLGGGRMHAVQLWVAQPEATRHGPGAFAHHADLPRVELDGWRATVIVGELHGARSPTRADTPLLGVELDTPRAAAATLPLRSEFEHAVVVLHGALRVDDTDVPPGVLAYLAPGRSEMAVQSGDACTALLLGGAPFEEQFLMFWNYVARTREEVTQAHRDWQAQSDRFGTVRSPLPRIPSPAPPWASSG